MAAAAAAAATQVLREKDTRIAALERELQIMEEEFTRELEKYSLRESERSTFWQARYESVRGEVEALRGELRRVRQREEEGRDGGERREVEVAAGRGEGKGEGMERVVRERDQEIRDLKRQIRGLKEWVSTSTRHGVASVADEELGIRMRKLGNELQEWVLINLRRARIDLSKADEASTVELGRLVPMYEELAGSAKVHLLQSLVSRLLVEHVFDAYFVGLSDEEAQQLAQVETFLSSFASSPEPINQWRSHSLTILKGQADQKLEQETSRITESIVDRVNRILNAITDTKTSEARSQGLRALIGSAIELSRLLVVQRAIFKVAMPEILSHQRTVFDPATMDDMGGEDEDALVEREICCVAFPGIIKRGDESGGHLQYRNVIAKARVLCSPE